MGLKSKPIAPAAADPVPQGPQRDAGVVYVSREFLQRALKADRSGVRDRSVRLVDPSLRDEVLYSDFDEVTGTHRTMGLTGSPEPGPALVARRRRGQRRGQAPQPGHARARFTRESG